MKVKQNRIGLIVIIVLLLLTLTLHFLSSNHKKTSVNSHQKTNTTVDGVLSTDFTKKNEMSALLQQQKQMDDFQKALEAIKNRRSKNNTSNVVNKSDLLNDVEQILSRRRADPTRIKSKTAILGNHGSPVSSPFSNASEGNTPLSNMAAPELETIQFNYAKPPIHNVGYYINKRLKQKIRTARNYVPAGTFARAVLLEGADANASVNAQSDTSPILVRILDSGTLPNGHHSHLKGCFVLASMYGDISSERGEARLTKLSCTRRDGSILERKVQGYLSFAGKEGIKGQPVMRNGSILEMAGLSGMLSGFGSAMQQSTQTQTISPLGATSTINPSKVFQGGLFGGASTAMHQLATYYIKRADQYHPIIEIGSGTVATLIFQTGFPLIDTQVANQSTNQITQGSVKTDPQEIKALIQQAQNLSRAKAGSPFSNVN